jgi:Spy/CpxP family protein refolding chaperone
MRIRHLLIAAVVAGAAGVAAAGPHHGRGPSGEGFLARHAEMLGLDDATQARIRELVDASHREAELLRAQKREAKSRLYELLSADEPDRDAVLDQVERLGALDTEKHKLRIETMMDIRAELTPEQRRIMKERREELRERHMGAMLDDCAEDAAELCEDAGPFPMRCLLHQRDALSEACAEALAEIPHGHMGHHGAHGSCWKGHGKSHGGPHHGRHHGGPRDEVPDDRSEGGV